ncbi:multiple myeloma tumor-associated protein 2 homolog isoform X2 [Patiria miniata]|uniref:Multiple myeloma tumor-associated protein 2-like N-terminal domain-containing protein n=1 Tax=Patiria miniata TaxID=46514 RepID=A0A913Z1I1_PATMI|nr:multiple myeloma tumor-associated protein 2 homolog isoform X2 [Patiria miniata]XP_038044909.1 multiple myeloma tumor-associated protein 2 homolog isoform X2 [Patiria miniata]
MYYIPRGGNRGGADQFSWSGVKTDKDREYYLGHSLKAPVGRWQDGRDLQWFNKSRKEGDSLADERRAIKQAEEEAMMAALGQKVVKSPSNAVSSTQDLNPAVSAPSGKRREDKRKKRSKRSHDVKSKKKRKKEKAKKGKKKSRSHKRSHRHSSSDSSSESSSSDSSSSDESEEEMTKHRRKHRPRPTDEDETWKNEISRDSKKHRVIETAGRRTKHHDSSTYDRGSHRHSDTPPEKHRDRDTNRQRGSDSLSKRRRPSDSYHHAKRDTESSYSRRERGKHSPRR